MPTILTRGLGNDTPIIVYRDIASGLEATVVVESRVAGEVEVDDDPTPIGAVTVEPLQVTGWVEVVSSIMGEVTSVQELKGFILEEGRGVMTVPSNQIPMFLRDDRTLSVAVSREGAPENLTSAKLWFTVKEKTSDPDNKALILKRNTPAGGDDTQVKVLTPATNGRVEIYIVPADTNNMNPGTYIYDIQVTLANGKTYTVTRDKITFKEDVTRTLA